MVSANEISVGEVKSNGVRHVNAEQASDLLSQYPEVVVIDVRTPREFASERIEGAINIDFYADDFADQIRKLDPEKTYLLHCRTGVRSGKSIPVLNSVGVKNLIHLDHGIRGWQGSGNKVLK